MKTEKTKEWNDGKSGLRNVINSAVKNSSKILDYVIKHPGQRDGREHYIVVVGFDSFYLVEWMTSGNWAGPYCYSCAPNHGSCYHARRVKDFKEFIISHGIDVSNPIAIELFKEHEKQTNDKEIEETSQVFA